MTRHHASFAFILATIALDALSFAIIVPVVPAMIVAIGHVHAAAASLWLGVIFSAFAFSQFLFAPIAGALSDRYGRRPVLLISQAVLGLNALCWVWVPGLWWLLGLRLVAGALAGNISAANAYVGDVTPIEKRARSYGLVGAMYGLGFVVGPALGGWLGGIWLRLPFLVAAGLIACNVLYGWLILPESLPRERRRAFTWARANAAGSLKLFAANGWTRRLGIAWACSWVALGSQQSSFILSNQMRFGWTIAENGLVLALGGIAQALVQGVLIGRITQRVGPRRTAALGYAFAVAGYGVYAIASRPWMMLGGLLLLACGALAGPSIQGMMSIAAGPKRQGENQGALSSLQGLSMVVGPTATGVAFAWATRPGNALHFPGLPFALSAALCLVGLAAVVSLPDPERLRRREALAG